MPLPNHITKGPGQLHWTFIYMCSEACAAKNYFWPKPKHSMYLLKFILKEPLKHSKISMLSLPFLKIYFFSLCNLCPSVHNLFTISSFSFWKWLCSNGMENVHIISDVPPFEKLCFPLSELYPEITGFNLVTFSH